MKGFLFSFADKITGCGPFLEYSGLKGSLSGYNTKKLIMKGRW